MVKTRKEVLTPKRKGPLTITRPLTRIRLNTAPVTTAGANIKVVVRVRPTNKKEDTDNHRNVIQVVDDQMLIFDPKQDTNPFFFHGVQQRGRDFLRKSNKDLQFMFDKVFSPGLPNGEVFKDTTQSLIDSLMNGFNCSVFAYGATGAGKTFTMIGNAETPGITYLTMAELFKRKEELNFEREFELGITYLEVYNENVQDLLNPGKPLHLREDSKYGVTVAGIKVHKIESTSELFALLESGNRNRTQHPTDANAESSRSHAVFQVYIQMTFRCSAQVKTAKLSMIDLAGSERASATGCAGARFAEGANINKSLLALGNCINSLADGQRHVPYRDSKLTRLLKDSLGGNCQTVMIANISPSSVSYEDTYNTLKYATRAKKIKSNMKQNVVNVELHVSHYVKIVEEQKEEIKLLKQKLSELEGKVSVPASDSRMCEELKQEIVELKKKLANGKIESIESLPETNELLSLFKEKFKIIDRIYNIECSELGMNIRRKLKEEADARVSDHCPDSVEKKDAHQRIGQIIDRFESKGEACKNELQKLQKEKVDLDVIIQENLTKNPHLQSIADLENLRLNNIEKQNEYSLLKKQHEIFEDEYKTHALLLEEASNQLKWHHVTLKGHGYLTEARMIQYNNLSKKLLGVKNIKFVEDISDSGVSSMSSLYSVTENKSPRGKLGEKEVLNDTFTFKIHHSKPKADHVISKVCKSPVPRRIIGKNALMKENNVRKPLASISSSARLASAKMDVKTITTKSTLADRPRFRR